MGILDFALSRSNRIVEIYTLVERPKTENLL